VTEHAWLIVVLPLVSWLLISAFGRRLKNEGDWLGVVTIGVTLVLSLVVLWEVAGGAATRVSVPWLVMGDWQLDMGYLIDPLAAVMLVVVTAISFLVHVYSMGYMHGDARYRRYFATLSFFTFSMLGLVVADNLILLFFFFELVGLASYLLIGHWYENLGPRLASLKAFIVTRIGDLAFLVGLAVLVLATGTTGIPELRELVEHHQVPATVLTLAAILVFGGAVGKSAQFPLHVWLPDAMEGPTPVSALIHAATMVAAGVYLVARSFFLFEPSATALSVVAVIGGITALLGATIGVLQTDMKRVMAYSTVSQLGYMMMALGVGSLVAGMFHLWTHAFFKALLFLAAGSVMHAMHTMEMHSMGGLYRKMPVTAWATIIGGLALAGVWPLAGFYSKEEILNAAFYSGVSGAGFAFWAGVISALLTAFYMTRAVILVFFGRPRDRHRYEHAHESPPVMTVPLAILMVLAVTAGWVNAPISHHWFGKLLGEAEVHLAPIVTVLAVGATLLGVAAGYAIYALRLVDRRAVINALRPVYTLVRNKYYFDELYNATVLRGSLRLAEWAAWFDQRVIDWLVNAVGYVAVKLSEAAGKFDLSVVDGLVNGAAAVTVGAGRRLRTIQTGFVQTYILTFFAALVVGLVVFQLWRL